MYGHVRPRPPWERDIPQAKSGKGLPKHVMKERLRDAADPHPLPANGPPAPWKKLEVAHATGQARVGEAVTASDATRRPFYTESDPAPPEYEPVRSRPPLLLSLRAGLTTPRCRCPLTPRSPGAGDRLSLIHI